MQTICLMILLLVVSASGLSDFEALLELKKGIEKGPSGQVLSSWDSKSLTSQGCPQNWYGVNCIDAGHVTSINLKDLGLVGSFSFPVLVSLRMLQNLSISNNHFTGTISRLSSLESLKYVDLSSNSFHGTIPFGIASLRSLEFLNLSSNNFEGTIPAGLGNLDKLKSLDLQGNAFSGDVMNLFSQLGSVAYVDISKNRFSGSLDLALGKPSFVSSIQYLNTSYNSLVGELFVHDGIPFFDSLKVFDATYNQLVGSIPSFNFIVSLRILRLRGNQLSGSLPVGLLQESSMILSELDLSLNQLEGPVGSITSATLKKLDLSSNKLSGPLPLKVGQCAIIDLSNNNLSGNLSRVQDWGNSVEVIRLSSNSLTGTLTNQTSSLLRLAIFQAANNSLQGALPPVLGSYPELQIIDFSLNQISGDLPENLFASTKFSHLNLSGNHLTGPIPLQHIQNAGNLSLATLDLSHNSLSGFFPKELSQFHNLVSLDLSDNKFVGDIPSDLPDDMSLFNVSLNNLSGDIPENLKQFPDSAFHPGNSLLRFPNSAFHPNDASNTALRKSRSHMKLSTKAGLIVGLIGGVIVLALAFILIFFAVQKQRRKEYQERNAGNKIEQHGEYSGSNPPKYKPDEPLPSSGIAKDYGSGNTSNVVEEPKNPDLVGPDKEKEVLLSPSSTAPSKDQHSPENLRGLKSCRAPDKLGGDLHIFDSSIVFTAEELSGAPAEALGRSCHGTLYRAALEDGCVLAVKWLREGITKNKKEFLREIEKLGNIKHPNLVSVDAYYWGPSEHEKLIISKYINAPCLAHYLQGTESRKFPPLNLENRLRIAFKVSKCLDFLHNDRAIPHGNLKSTNILLEPPSLTARLTDYSLHRLLTPEATAEQVVNAGALGYRPPEFASSSKPCPSLKSDVYAFGVILLELLTGKSSGEVVSGDSGVVELTDWVRLLAGQNRAMECFDESIFDKRNLQNLFRVLNNVLKVALACILPASERPDMRSVFEELSGILCKERL